MFVRVQDGVIIILLIYIDDILVACNNLEVVSKFKTFLHDQFKLKDLGSLKYFLGLEVARSSKSISLYQRKYVLELLAEASQLASRPVSFPMEQHAKLSNHHGELLPDPTQYRRLIGKLLCLTLSMPDIAFNLH